MGKVCARRRMCAVAAAAAATGCAIADGRDGSAQGTDVRGLPGPGESRGEGHGADRADELPYGLRGEYFRRYGERVLERIDPTIDMGWGDGELAPGVGLDRASIRWTGYLDVAVAGRYTLATINDDGVRVRVAGALAIDDWRGHFPERHEAVVDLPAGLVPIEIEYFEIDLTAELRLLWGSIELGLAEQVIPTEHLRAAPSGPPSTAPHPPVHNPVVGHDCPDPGVMAADGAFYMVCTGGSFPIRRSDDLVFWSDTGAAVLPAGKPAWSANGWRDWAPELHRVGDHYVAYYTAVNAANVLSIGAASAPSPTGPYTDRGSPLVEHPTGIIDPSYFRDDDGRHYLLMKVDGNSIGQPTPVWIRELAPDGLSFVEGAPTVEILRNDPATFEGGTIEGMWLVKRDGMYYLFYSGNVYDHRYRTSVARSASLTGPYQKRGWAILANNAAWVGPGHGSVVPVGDETFFVYHAWRNNGAGVELGAAGRQVLIDRIRWIDGWPRIGDGTPTVAAQLWPGDG